MNKTITKYKRTLKDYEISVIVIALDESSSK
jgi:hypothetical protein